MPQTRLREVISYRSLLPYLAWRAGIHGKGEHKVRLTSGATLILRPPPTTDLGNAMEVFLFSVYAAPEPLGSLSRIVDLGANVGYSVVYFARQFPGAKLIAWEPHPHHVRQLRANVAANGLTQVVSIHAFAAGSKTETKWLIDEGTRSHVVDEYRPNSLRIEVRDWLESVQDERIDLLKIDIEGGEYQLLFDERFKRLQIPRLVVECHCDQKRPRGDEEASDLLQSLGYRVHRGHAAHLPDMRTVLLWAFRH